MAFRRRLSHLLALGLKRSTLLLHPTLSRFERYPHFRLGTLLMPVGANHRLAARIDIEGAMLNHPLEGVFLKLGSSPVHLGPLPRLQPRLHLRGPPVHQGLAISRFDDHKVATIPLSHGFPGTLIEPRAIVKGLHFSRFKTLETVMLVVVEHAKQAQPQLVKGLRQGL